MLGLATATQLLFEDPVWGIAAGLIVATGAMFRWSRTRQRLDITVAAVGLAVAVLFFVADAVVVTDRERVSTRTTQLIEATAPADATALRSLLTDDFVVTWSDGAVWLEADAALERVVSEAESRGLSHASIAVREAEVVTPSQARTLVHIRTSYDDRDITQRYVTTDWRITWRKEPDGQWRASEAQWLELFGRPMGGGWLR